MECRCRNYEGEAVVTGYLREAHFWRIFRMSDSVAHLGVFMAYGSPVAVYLPHPHPSQFLSHAT